jgi:SagB-type dehydrogenase family enzyme
MSDRWRGRRWPVMSGQHAWRPLTTVTPGCDHFVEVDSPLAGWRVRLHRDALLRLLAGKSIPSALRDGLVERGLLDAQDDDEEPSDENLVLWQGHGWGLSLPIYAWSRSVAYYDSGPDEYVRRSEALDSMLRERSCPMPPEPDPSAVTLPDPDGWKAPSLGAVIAKRRSVGAFRSNTIDQEVLAALLHHGTSKMRECRRLSSSEDPQSLLISVGAAFDVYVLVYSVHGLAPGAYLYELEPNALSLKRPGNLRESVRAAFAGQPDPTNAAATVLLVADFDRYQWRYRHERALRNLYLESGRLMQPLILVATALGLQTGITPAIRDQLVGALLALDSENWQALHTLTVA